MHNQPDYDGKQPKKGDQGALSPGDQTVSAADPAIGDFRALVEVANLSPNPDFVGVAVCARNFTNTATVALRRGSLSPDLAAALLNLRISNTGELAFVYAKQIDPLLTEVSRAIKDKITNDSGYFVSFDTLESLARFVAEENGIGVSARLVAYEAIIIGSTRSIQVRRKSSDSQRRESSEIISQISQGLTSRAFEHTQEVAELVQGIGKTRTNLVTAEPVGLLLKHLSTAQIPETVQDAARRAMAQQLSLSQDQGTVKTSGEPPSNP
jgi:hypothetical protein